MQKQCTKCHRALPLSEFWRASAAADGYYWWCKSCGREYKRSPSGRESSASYVRKWRARNPERWSAQKKVMHAVAAGKLERRPCKSCGKKAHAHHNDYSKPLDVEWLCAAHHRERHAVVH